MPKVTDEHRASRRQQIIEAAAACFGRQGFHQTTMRDICSEADLSPGAVYGYFDGKDDLIAAVAAAGRASTRELFDHVRAEHDGLSALEAAFGYVFQHMDTDAGLRSTRLSVRLWGEHLDLDALQAVLDQGYASTVDLVADAIREAQARDEVDSTIDPVHLARLVVAVYQGLAVQKVHAPDMDVSALFDLFRRMLHTGLAGSS
jgi:AcrR family transcriptional regulator